MRLIDADEYKGKVIASHCYSGVNKIIRVDDIPTAYDIDKVVEELKDLGGKYCTNVSCNYECKDCSHGIFMQKAIEIVKQGLEE